MSKSFSKNKEKRMRMSSNEDNTSFVKNVTSRVSGLLPATITKWFSSPSSSNANGSTPTAEATDSSTEDEGPETSVVTQPSAKRMRFNTSSTPSTFNHFGSTYVNCTTSNIEITEIPVSHFSGSQFSTNRNTSTATSIRSPNETFSNDSMKDKNERDTSRYKTTQHIIANIGHSVAAKRKSIFDKTSNDTSTKTNTKPSTSEAKRPCNKSTLLGSPFYPGRTIYGGAASSYINQPNIQQHTVASVNETKTNEDSAMSTSARRIMDLLEAYSSPLMEARRIPQYTKPKHETFNMSANQSSLNENRSLSYKTQELHVPSIASILRLKQRSRLMDTTKAARQIIASHSSASSSTLPYPTTATKISKTTNTTHLNEEAQSRSEPETEKTTKMITKVKTRVARTNRGNQDQTEMATPVKLPSATLQIDQDKLPKFSFDTPTVTNFSATSTPKVVLPVPKPIETKKNTEVSTSKPETVTSSSVFKFSNPINISCDSPEPNTTPPKFTFDSPERHIDQNCGSKTDVYIDQNCASKSDVSTDQNCASKSDVSFVIGKAKETDKSTTSNGWTCPDCWVNNKSEVPKCACCGYTRMILGKCSVCKIADCQSQKDKCDTCVKMATLPLPASSQASKWKCDDCWVMNEDSLKKCSCCGARKPTDAIVSVQSAVASENAKEKTETVNSRGKSLTVSSDQFNPKQATNFFGSNDRADSALVSLGKSQKSDKWECPSCLVSNENDKSACVCCGAENDPKDPSKVLKTKFNFGVNANTFKFGIDPKLQEAQLNKVSEGQITPEPKLKEHSETNNNVLAETPTFTFTLPAKKPVTKTESVEQKPAEPVKFSFGIPKNVTISTNKSELPKIANEDKEKFHEVPQVNFSSAVEDKQKLGGLFSAPLKVEKEKPLIPTSNFTLPTVEAKIAVTSEETQPQNTFTLGSSTLKPNTNLFGTPSTVSSSANLFSSPVQSSAVTTSESKAPLILPLTSAQKIETHSALPAPAAPIFSFGSNGVNNPTPMPSLPAASPAEKPKFQFTFGSSNSSKTESAPSLLAGSSNTQSVFKPHFAPPGENDSKNTNTFSLTPGNALVPNNAQASSTLGTNGISTTNGLVGNTLPGNTIGGNALSGNSLSGNLLGNNSMANNTFGSKTSGNAGSSTSTLGGNNGLPGIAHSGGNSLQPSNALNNSSLNTTNAPNIFGNAVQKENMWNQSSNNNASSTNLFVSNTTTNSLQKPAAFTFGTSTPFNATSASSAFGNNAQPTQPTQNIFGMANQNNNSQPSLFSNPVSNQTPTPMFGSSQPNSNPATQLGMFGTPNLGASSTFGAPSPSVPSFEAPSMTPAPAPAFSFTPVFGFGQQQPQQPQLQQEQTGNVYSFGAQTQVQFNMGTAQSNPMRRIRKARRTQR